MTQISPVQNFCTCPQCCPAQTNNYSGVKIDIANPAVNLPPAITAPIYDIPQTSIYEPNKAAEVTAAEEVK